MGRRFWQAAEGTMQFDVRDGVLPHIALASDEGPLRVNTLARGMRGCAPGKD